MNVLSAADAAPGRTNVKTFTIENATNNIATRTSARQATAKTTAADAKDRTNRVLVTVVLDRSGSMSGNRAGTISGYNEYIHGLRFDEDSEYSVTLIQFDAPMAKPELTVNYQDCALADVPELTPDAYVPRGNTPLYDAIGECIRRTNPEGRAVIVLVITDGEENASTEFTRDSVKALLRGKESEGWTFAFLGADIDSYAVGGSVGISPSNTANYVKGNEKALFSSLAKSTIRRAASARTVGPNAAVDTDFIDDSQRAQIVEDRTVTGGGHAAPPLFRPRRASGAKATAPRPGGR
jgi:hypothetical protein